MNKILELGVISKYNELTGCTDVFIPGANPSKHDRENDILAELRDLCEWQELDFEATKAFLEHHAKKNRYHPAKDWIESKPFGDGNPFNELVISLDLIDRSLAASMLRKWLIGAVAALYSPGGIKPQGILVLQGREGVGKTTWLKALAGGHGFGEGIAFYDNSVLPYWICELCGPINIAELGISLCNDYKKACKTAYCGSMHTHEAINDNYDKSKYWIMPVNYLELEKMPDIQQLWAQVKGWMDDGETYLLNDIEIAANKRHHTNF